jgi:hypothetical protein
MSQTTILPKEAVKGIATGLLMMASFTLIWAGIAFGGLYPTVYQWPLLLFPLASLWFISNAIGLFKLAKFFPPSSSEADIAEGKKMGMWFGIIFGAEGLLIFIGVNVVVNLGHADLTLPVIALVVALHFFPMAKVFKRTLDYYVATWSTLIAIGGFIFTLYHSMPAHYIQAFLGIGMAIATTCYGSYMVFKKRAVAKINPGKMLI